MDNLPTASHHTPEPDPGRIIAGLMLDSGVTPDQLEGVTGRLAEIVPSTAEHRQGAIAAYYELARQGNGGA